MARPRSTLLGGRGRRPHGRLRGSGAEADGVPRTTDPRRGGLPIHGGPEPAPWSDSAAAGKSGAFRAAGSFHRRRSKRLFPADFDRAWWDNATALQPSLDTAAPAVPVRAVSSGRTRRVAPCDDTSLALAGSSVRFLGGPVAPEPVPPGRSRAQGRRAARRRDAG